MGTEGRVSLDLRGASGEQINDAVADGVMEVLDLHRRAGRPVIAWADGEVVEVPADGIEIPTASAIAQADFAHGQQLPSGS